MYSLDGVWNDLPTGLAVAGLVVYVLVSAALVWWASRHYVASAATSWQWSTWDQTVEGRSEMQTEGAAERDAGDSGLFS